MKIWENIKTIGKRFWQVILVPVSIIFSLVPKNKDLWLFSSWSGDVFLDNPKYIFKYICGHDRTIQVIWICSSSHLVGELTKAGYSAVHRFSLNGIWCQVRAGVVVYSHAVRQEFNSVLIGRQTLRVQTWHGVPIKKIGFDDKYSDETLEKERYRHILLPYLADRPDLVLACSEQDKNNYISAFNVPESSICITGYSRNDALYNERRVQLDGDFFKQVIYMPTLRGRPESSFALMIERGFDYHKFNELMIKHNSFFFVTTHPAQKLSPANIDMIDGCSNISIKATSSDIYEELGTYDILITDYSGAYIDFLLLDKPIIMAAIDLEEYMSHDRQLYYHYPDICPSPPCAEWSQVFTVLEMALEGNYDQQRLADLRSTFHKHTDGHSSQRSYDAIKNRLSRQCTLTETID